MRAMMGQGVLGMATDVKAMYPLYQEQMSDLQMSGESPIPFEEWMQRRQVGLLSKNQPTQSGLLNR